MHEGEPASGGLSGPPGPSPFSTGPAVRAALKLIWIYQHYISPFTPPSCRFTPTCSHYTYQAIERFGLWRGGWLGLGRLCKCHPCHRGGYDPLPHTFAWPRLKPVPAAGEVVGTTGGPEGRPSRDS